MEMKDLIKNIDVIANFKKKFGINEDYEKNIEIEKLGLRGEQTTNKFISNNATTLLATDVRIDFKKYVIFSGDILKQAIDVLKSEEKKDIVLVVSLDEVKPSVVINRETNNAIVIAPRIEEVNDAELNENAEINENAEEIETEADVEEIETEAV